MNNQEPPHMTATEFLKATYHELNQKSAAALTITLMLNDERTPLTIDKRKELLLMLEREIRAIRKVSDMIYDWLSAE